MQARLALSVRRGRAVSQSELAREVGVTPQAWSAWEAGSEPDYAMLAKLSKILGVTAGWLVAGEGPPPSGGSKVELPPARPAGPIPELARKKKRA